LLQSLVNHVEFFTRKHEWLSKSGHSPSDTATVLTVKATTSRQSSSQITSSSDFRHSSKSSDFSKLGKGSSSSRLTSKCLELEAKLKTAQLESEHLKQKAEEKQQLLQLETAIESRAVKCKIAFAQIEYKVYKEDDTCSMLSCDVTTQATFPENTENKSLSRTFVVYARRC